MSVTMRVIGGRWLVAGGRKEILTQRRGEIEAQIFKIIILVLRRCVPAPLR